ncbi:MAG TPA: hypothetical protein VIR54_11270 [Vicinamibacterales bacterium]
MKRRRTIYVFGECDALEDKCPKLAAWAADGRTSVLVLEPNDIQLSNVFVAFDAFKTAIGDPV